ncbi:carotenoid oxygenase family protein [Streptomyces sp. NBC_01320]|uniref:carotenoid oxygenase family protein n=1 Tax=Streptomyces sp. NBC_01320 TaxID=2903824 RepID=UPI002E109088|nr:carotenoid oxygenase family protein [Streptomyces sp. NBC_01320]
MLTRCATTTAASSTPGRASAGPGPSGLVGTREPGRSQAPAVLHRWILDPAADHVTESQPDDCAVEFPTHDNTLTGRPNHYLYAAAGPTRPRCRATRRQRQDGRRHHAPSPQRLGVGPHQLDTEARSTLSHAPTSPKAQSGPHASADGQRSSRRRWARPRRRLEGLLRAKSPA